MLFANLIIIIISDHLQLLRELCTIILQNFVIAMCIFA